MGSDHSKSKIPKIPKIPPKKMSFYAEIRKYRHTDRLEQGDTEYPCLVEDLQEEMADLFRSRHSKMSLPPSTDETVPLLEFFEMPDLVRIEEKRRERHVWEEKTPVQSMHDMITNSFEGPEVKYRFSYVFADAGQGKTVFSKRLALTWAQAKRPLPEYDQYFNKEEIEAIGEFSLMFLLLLCDTPEECDIDQMIRSQIISQLSSLHCISIRELEAVLAYETCLVVLDGLDEWSHPSICNRRDGVSVPHRRPRPKMKIFTMTRPWRFSTSGVRTNQFDQKLYMIGLNKRSASNLKTSLLTYFMSKDRLSPDHATNIRVGLEEFSNIVRTNSVSNLATSPFLLTYLLQLWNDRKKLYNTKCELYSNIVELLISMSLDRVKEMATSPVQAIPVCFNGLENCQKFLTYINALGKFAFDMMFRESEGEAFERRSMVLERCLDRQTFQFCFETCLLSQRKCIQRALLEQWFEVSFIYKSMQQFFVTLYLFSAPDDTELSQIITAKCTSVKTVIDMSELFMFISGMIPKMAAFISHDIMGSVSEDETTQEFRNSTHISSHENPLKKLQDMIVSCRAELPPGNDVSLCLQDVFIDENCNQKEYRDHLQNLTMRNRQNIKSVYINLSNIKETPYDSVQKAVDYFGLGGVENVTRINVESDQMDEGIVQILHEHVECLSLSSSGTSMPLLIMETAILLRNLKAIELNNFGMSHLELRLLYGYITENLQVKEVKLGWVRCTDHGDSCAGLALDLKQHSQLKMLTLAKIPLTEVNTNMTSLQWVNITELSLSAIKFHVDIPNKTEPTESPPAERCIRLCSVELPDFGLSKILDAVEALPISVSVEISSCVLQRRREFEEIKERIKNLSPFRLRFANANDMVQAQPPRFWLAFRKLMNIA